MANNHLRTALSRIRRSPYQSTAAVLIMTMTLFLASFFFILAAGSQAILKYFETRPQINAYFQQDYVPPPQEVERIISQLEATGKIEIVKYNSKEDALRIYKQLNKSDPLLLEAVTASMLPASFEISAIDPNSLKPLAEILKKEPHIDDVRFAEDIVNSLTKWTTSVRIIGTSLVGIHAAITFLVILLIIGIKVASRREEIAILGLLGATRGFITAPFVWEGVLYGLVGAIIAWFFSIIILLYSMPFLVSFLSGIPVLPPPAWFFLVLLVGELIAGVGVGGLGGAAATHRFFKS